MSNFCYANHNFLVLVVQLGVGFAIAGPMLSDNSDFSKLFNDCKEYIVATCQGNSWSEKVDDLCQVGCRLSG